VSVAFEKQQVRKEGRAQAEGAGEKGRDGEKRRDQPIAGSKTEASRLAYHHSNAQRAPVSSQLQATLHKPRKSIAGMSFQAPATGNRMNHSPIRKYHQT